MRLSVYKRLYFRLLFIGILFADGLMGGLFPRLHPFLHHLHQLIWERRYKEFNQTVFRVLFRVLPFLSRQSAPVSSPKQADISSQPDPILLDARTHYLNKDGVRLDKRCFVFRSYRCPLLISVIIHASEERERLEKTVSSALDHAGLEIELLILTGESSAQSVSEKLKSTFDSKRLRVVSINNEDIADAQDRAIEMAEGEYICFLYSGDIIEPTFFDKCISCAESNHSVGFVFSIVEEFEKHFFSGSGAFTRKAEEVISQAHFRGVFRRDDWKIAFARRKSKETISKDLMIWDKLESVGRNGFLIPEVLGRSSYKCRSRNHRTPRHIQSIISKSIKMLDASVDPDLTCHSGQIFHKLSTPPLYADNSELPHIIILIGNTLGQAFSASSLIVNLLIGLESAHRISLITLQQNKSMSILKSFVDIPESYCLQGFLSQPVWPDFVEAIVSSRQTQLIVTLGLPGTMMDFISTLKRKYNALTWAVLIDGDCIPDKQKSFFALSNYVDSYLVPAENIRQYVLRQGICSDKIEVFRQTRQIPSILNLDITVDHS